MSGMRALKRRGWYPRLCSGSGVRELFQFRPSGLQRWKLEPGCGLGVGARNERGEGARGIGVRKNKPSIFSQRIKF